MAESFVFAGQRVKVYDLSERLSNETGTFQPNKHSIEYIGADETAAMTGAVFGIGPELWPDSKGYCIENVSLSTHSGTHVDAPAHYGPQPGGAEGRTIDEVPLRWCFGDGVRLDMRHKAKGEGIDRLDVENELGRIGYQVKPHDIVLVWTGASRHYLTPGYDQMHPGMRRDATEYLVDSGVHMIGIDAWSLDRPFDVMIEEAKAGNHRQLWESHLLGREKEYSQIEKLCNLESLPASYGFTVIALPVKIAGASGGWTRVVALVPEGEGAPP